MTARLSRPPGAVGRWGIGAGAHPRLTQSPPGALGALGAAGSAGVIVGDGPGGGGRGSGAPAPTGRPAWWDGVSHVVTPPAREHVT